MRDLVFRLVLIAISAIILHFEYRLYSGVRARFGDRRWYLPLTVLFWMYAASAKLPFVLMILLPRDALFFSFDGVSRYWYYSVLAWAYPMFFFGLFSLLAKFGQEVGARLRSLARHVRDSPATVRETDDGEPPPAAASGAALSRAEVLRGAAGALPVALHFSIYGSMIAGSREFVTKEIRLPIRDLPEDLLGFRVVQISDVHVGVIVSGRYLDLLSDVLRHVRGDLLTVTGDILDNNNAFIPEAGRFFRSLTRSFGGMLGVLGNHDYIHNAEAVFQRLPHSGLELLRNRVVRVRRGRAVLQVLGLDYPGRRMGNAGARLSVARRFYRDTAALAEEEGPRILLNHHPSDFTFLRKEPIDLVLSGHTHGGQIVFTRERESPLAPASLVFPYYRGMYQEGSTRLYVNSGVGHWLPLRVNTPPEITVFELERA